ncbi:hypothetical protein SAMD00019534_088120 [Acytostelium subglobosum LB1]|uniref:hypothetical protein n=1 Tax=Acytostelium subglobosum LB1 TaxID=1410327 RepID=UPI0006447E09|nr:hypothetical protein SAMD00019534_088120 [Acytostelium subglobosum LB1]GAM25637.1 hypothetical protein SAMD00019534_088120 [Acytostelium subglobosum LB1]|eukprot:XP_012751623.1 hypothetical protein SAMD00019534_088120 [Acytostelium subglobosum LB1]
MSQFLQSLGRKVAVVNLDPANENIPYTASIDIRSLIDFDTLMKDEELGPNGALIYAIEYLEQNIDWLIHDNLSKFKDHYIIFDCPGQVELYTHYKSMSNILEQLVKQSFRLTVIQVFDSFYCKAAATFISVLLVSLSSMLRIEMPHINVLSKIDLIETNGPLDFSLEYYSEVMDLSYLNKFLDSDVRHPRYAALNKAIAGLVEDFSLVSFHPLNVMEKENMAELIKKIDKSNGFVYNSLNSDNSTIMQLTERYQDQWQFDLHQEKQEKYYKSGDINERNDP